MHPMQKLIHYYCHMKIPSEATLPLHEHLDTLKRYADKCQHVTEMGFRYGVSFTAFLMAQPKKLVTYDLEINEELKEHFNNLKNATDIQFIQSDTAKVEIEETDLLFIDTLHTYTHLKTELNLHGNKARKFLIFHDTETFGDKGEDGSTPGLLQAIFEFTQANSHWFPVETFQNCNGMIILRRA